MSAEDEDGPLVPENLLIRAGEPCFSEATGVRLRYLPAGVAPNPKQAYFCASTCRELFFGGSGGGGKSFALLMGALMFADVPGYSALILRRNLTDLSQPGALISMSREWLDDNPAASYNANERKWTFDTGGRQPAIIQFGYLSHVSHIGRYRGAEYHYLAFDELGEFPLSFPYRFLFSRVRRPAGLSREDIIARFGQAPDGTTLLDMPLRVRSASNPGGSGMVWVRRRFVDPGTRRAPYLPATFLDNPAIDADEYRQMLAMLPEVERRRMELGDWSIQEIPGALWTLDSIRRHPWTPEQGTSMFDRVLVGIDPSVGEGAGDECGIVAAAVLSATGQVVVLRDESMKGHPDMWSARAVLTAETLGATGFVVEGNQGAQLLRTQLRDAADRLGVPPLPVFLGNAKGSKERRAMTIASGYTSGNDKNGDLPLIVHAVGLAGGDLEAQMVGWVPGASKAESGVKSPDRVDALVWALRGLIYPDSIDDFSKSLSTPATVKASLTTW